jgi:hypothetical protein
MKMTTRLDLDGGLVRISSDTDRAKTMGAQSVGLGWFGFMVCAYGAKNLFVLLTGVG